MASMQQIIVKITGQDGLSPMLVKIAKSVDNVNKSGKKLSTSFASSLKQMEKQSSKSATQINKSLNQANKIKFKTLSGGFKTTVKQMEKQAQGASKNINKGINKINKTQFKPLSKNFQTATKGMEKEAQGASKNINKGIDKINKTQFKPLSKNFQTATKTMGTLSKISDTDIGNALAHVNNTQFIGLSKNFQKATKTMGTLSKITATDIGHAFAHVNNTQFIGLSKEFQKATETMETQSKISATDIGNALAHVNNIPFIGLSANFQTAIKGMETQAQGASKTIDLALETVNKTQFKTVSHNFDNTMKGMERSAQSTTRSITSSFSGLGTAIAGLGLGMGVSQLFDTGKERAVTGVMLRNRFGAEGQAYQNEYYKYTKISSTPDFQVNRLFRGAIGAPGAKAEHMPGLLKASDALSTTGDVDDFKLRLALMDYMATGGYKRLSDDFGSDTAKWLGGQWDLANQKKDPQIIQNAMEYLAKHLGRMSPEGEAITTTFEGEMGAYNKTLAALDNIVQSATKAFNTFLKVAISPLIDLLTAVDNATGGFLTKLAGGGLIVGGLVIGLGFLASGLFQLKDILGGVGKKIPLLNKFFGKKLKLDMDCGVCPPGSLLGGQGGLTPVPGGGGKIPTVEKGTKGKGRLGGVGRSLGAITRLSGRAGTALRGVASAVGLFAVAETAAAIAGSAMFLPIIAGAAAAGIAIYALTAGMRKNADTMKGYNDALKNGENRINELKEKSESYKKKVTELTAAKNKLKAAGKDVTGVEREIQSSLQKSAQAARDAAVAEGILKRAREEHKTIKDRSVQVEDEYTNKIRASLKATGRYSDEQLDRLTGQNKSLTDGTALMKKGLTEKERILGEGTGFADYALSDKNPRSEAWLKDESAMENYSAGMLKLGKLEEDYMNADSWTEKAGIWFEQGITKFQVDWIKAMVGLGANWDAFIKSIGDAGAYITGAWGNTVKWFEGLSKSIGDAGAYITGAWKNTVKWFEGLSKRLGELGGEASAYIAGAWGNTVKWVTDGWNGFVKKLQDTYNRIKGAWKNTVDWLKNKWRAFTQPIVDVWNNYVVKPLIGTYNWIKQKWHETMSWLGTQWNTYIQPIIDGAKRLEDTVRPVFDNIAAAANRVIDPLKTIYCTVMGCSPGIIPAFKKLGLEVPRQIGKTLPHLEALSSAMNIPSTNFEVSAIPSLDPSALDSLSVPLTSSGSDGYGSSTYNNRSTVSTVYNDHNHYHEPITINAKDMSLSEFKSTLVSVLEEGNRRYTPP